MSRCASKDDSGRRNKTFKLFRSDSWGAPCMIWTIITAYIWILSQKNSSGGELRKAAGLGVWPVLFFLYLLNPFNVLNCTASPTIIWTLIYDYKTQRKKGTTGDMNERASFRHKTTKIHSISTRNYSISNMYTHCDRLLFNKPSVAWSKQENVHLGTPIVGGKKTILLVMIDELGLLVHNTDKFDQKKKWVPMLEENIPVPWYTVHLSPLVPPLYIHPIEIEMCPGLHWQSANDSMQLRSDRFDEFGGHEYMHRSLTNWSTLVFMQTLPFFWYPLMQ